MTTTPHADLECPVCGTVCKPVREYKEGGASYRCRNTTKHADFYPLYFRIDEDGELHY